MENSFNIRRLIRSLAHIGLPVLVDCKCVKSPGWWPLCNPELAINADVAEKEMLLNQLSFTKKKSYLTA